MAATVSSPTPITMMQSQAEAPALDRELVGRMFDMTDGQWEAKVRSWNPQSGIVDGEILYQGEVAGQFMRTLNVHARCVIHVSYGLKANYQRRGFTRTWIAHCLDAYREAGFETVKVMASGDGRIVWAKLGFEVNAYEWDSLLHDVAQQIEALTFSGEINADEISQRSRQLIELRSGSPRLLELLAVPYDAAGVECALEHLSWHGSLNLH